MKPRRKPRRDRRVGKGRGAGAVVGACFLQKPFGRAERARKLSEARLVVAP